jgi:hypothetical protein
VEDTPTPAKNTVVNRFPLIVTANAAKNYSENLDQCIQGLAANATNTDKKDWYLTSANSTGSGIFNVTYDAELKSDKAANITSTFERYVSSGNLDKDIAAQCNETAVAVTPAGETTRAALGDNSLSGKGGSKPWWLFGVAAAIGVLTLIGAFVFGKRKRRRSISAASDVTSVDGDYARNTFATSDIETGHVEPDLDVVGTGIVKPSVDDIAEPTSGPHVISAAAGGDRHATDGGTSLRDESGNFIMDRSPSPVDDSFSTQHPHDYVIGHGPVTSETPMPTPGYMAPAEYGSTSTGGFDGVRDSVPEGYSGMRDAQL